MSGHSKRLRDWAAEQLRASRKAACAVTRSDHAKRAASYKALAENEQWLQGEIPRSKAGSPRKR